jgi:hypothetical protein
MQTLGDDTPAPTSPATQATPTPATPTPTPAPLTAPTPATQDPQAGGAPSRQRSRQWAQRSRSSLRLTARPIAIFLASRVVVAAGLAVGAFVNPHLGFHDSLFIYDGDWFRQLIEHGYPTVASATEQSPVAFFPLFPLLARALQAITGLSGENALLLFNLIAGCALSVAIWQLARQLFRDQLFGDRPSVAELSRNQPSRGETSARQRADVTTALVCFFPGSYVLTMPYSETLAITLAAWCLLALLRSRWATAGVLAALATATRPNMVALCVAAAVACALAIHRRRDWRSLLAPLLAPAGALLTFAYLWRKTGDRFAWFTSEKAWDEHVDFGRHNLSRLVHGTLHPFDDLNITFAALSMIFTLVAAGFMLKWRPSIILWAYTVPVIGLAATTFVVSVRPRFILTAFPLLFALARPLRGTWAPITVGVFAGALAILCVLTTGTIYLTP